MKLQPKARAPLVVLVVALVATTALIVVRPKAEPQQVESRHPVVRVVSAQPTSERPRVAATGTVAPRIESDLVAEVAGRVVWVSQRFEAGAFFDAGEELLRIEPRDHDSAAERARAGVQRAESQLDLAQATRGRVERLRARGASSSAKLEEAASNEGIASANLRDARAQAAQAELDLERTRVRAPFAGRVRTRTAELGQFVGRGTSLAAIFATDAALVRLPIPADELALLELDLVPDATQRGIAAIGMPTSRTRGPRVVLRAPQAGPEAVWSGEIVRAEGVLDDRTRMVNVVARVANPYEPEAGPPLTMGLFVEASIEGRRLDGVIALPRAAVRPGGEVLVVGDDSRLHRRPVTILRSEGARVWVTQGLRAGERVCATPPSVVVEGMPVRIADEPAPTEPASEERGESS